MPYILQAIYNRQTFFEIIFVERMSKPSEIDHISRFLGKVLNDSDKTKLLTVRCHLQSQCFLLQMEEDILPSGKKNFHGCVYCIAFGQPTSGDMFA